MTTNREMRAWGPIGGSVLLGLLLVWLAGAAVIGTERVLANTPPSPFPPIAVTAALPVAAFLAAYALSARLRRVLLALDLRMLTMLQLWRVVGFAFIPLHVYGVLPGVFAWPAGLGDLGVGVAAVFVVARMQSDPGYARGAGFVWFHILGLVDFAVAIVAAGLSAGAFPALITDGVTSAPMDTWPLNLFPSFLVPIFIILHLTVLLSLVERRRSARPAAER